MRKRQDAPSSLWPLPIPQKYLKTIFLIRPCHVILEYGAPILPRELTKEEKKFLGSYTQNRIQEMLDKNKSLI